MAGRVMKRVVINTKVLDEWLDKNDMTYKDLAERTGMSTTQAYNLTKRSTGGAVTLGYLIDLEIPDLLYQITYDMSGHRRRVVDARPIELRATR